MSDQDPGEYHVEWAIDGIPGDTPVEAAQRALEIQRDPESIATVFVVSNDTNRWQVDLTEGHVIDQTATAEGLFATWGHGAEGVIRIFAHLDPLEWNQGEKAYEPETQEFIHRCREWVRVQDEEGD